MKALVYEGPGKKSFKECPKPTIQASSDAVVKITKTTICGTDLHILKGDVPACKPGTILGHEGVGVVDEVGASVNNFKPGDRVLLSCITSCGKCDFCKKSMYAHCRDGGWILGHKINGTQAEYVRIPHADNSMYRIPAGLDESALVMLSDILPTGFEIGVLNGKVKPGDTVAIVGSGPIGLAALLTAQFFSPANVIMVDLDDNRLEVAQKFGASHKVNSSDGKAVEKIMQITNNEGVDVAIEAVGVPATFDICQKIVAPGGNIAVVGVHGVPVDLHLEDLWIKNINMATGLVSTYTTPMLLKTVQAGKVQPTKLITHTFKMDDMLKAYETFSKAADFKTLKVIIEA